MGTTREHWRVRPSAVFCVDTQKEYVTGPEYPVRDTVAFPVAYAFDTSDAVAEEIVDHANEAIGDGSWFVPALPAAWFPRDKNL